MNYKSNLIALSCRDHKQCALFFDWLSPIARWSDIPADYPNKISEEIIERFFNEEIDEYFFKIIAQDIGFCTRMPGSDQDLFNRAMEVRENLLAKGILAVPVIGSHPQIETKDEKLLSNIFELDVMGANLIDTARIKWEQIFEFRKDRDARNKLRNFRLFLYEQYPGKSSDFIKDSLHKKIEDYEITCKKHGFKLIEGTIACLLDSKSILGIMSITAAGILVGDSTITNAALLSGAAIEIGKITLKMTSSKRDFKSFKENHELAYIFTIKNELENKK